MRRDSGAGAGQFDQSAMRRGLDGGRGRVELKAYFSSTRAWILLRTSIHIIWRISTSRNKQAYPLSAESRWLCTLETISLYTRHRATRFTPLLSGLAGSLPVNTPISLSICTLANRTHSKAGKEPTLHRCITMYLVHGGVTFDVHQLRNANRTLLAHSPEIVPDKVHDH